MLAHPPAADRGTAPPRRKPTSSLSFLLLSLLFHLVYISAVFDIYFTSPVVHPEPRFGIKDTFPPRHASISHSGEHDFVAPADRLVLIVGDGLRADTLYKQHPAAKLPGWASSDLSRHAGPLDGLWQDYEVDPLESDYPYPLALDDARQQRGGDFAANDERGAFCGPFLRSVAKHRGVWGLSHTRVPTESRPGHVAMIAGMYEDVSAVTKGWKLNPIAFDSVLNQSSHSFAFGSPDIVPMFAIGAASDRVDMWTYDEEAEDFTKDATALDLWVLERLKNLFRRAKEGDATLASRLRQRGTVFFLHLLGLDSTGHTYRPASAEYLGNTIVVDALAREVELLFDDFYGSDGKTAYVFTADHGMSSKGNHGDGHPDNTRTPIVAWGAGVREPSPSTSEERERRQREAEADDYFGGWLLDELARVDIDQADIAPLMAALIGVPTPANSEGKLRVDMLDLSEEHKARALLANAMQVLETYRVKHKDRRRRMLRYMPYLGLAPHAVDGGRTEPDVAPGEFQIGEIRSLIQRRRFDEATARSEELIDLALDGSRYLQEYDWLWLCTIVSAGYAGSVLYSLAFLLRAFMLPEAQVDRLPRPGGVGGLGKAIVTPVFGLLCAKFVREEAPLTHYAYSGLACFLWGRVVDERKLYAEAFRSWRSDWNIGRGGALLRALLGLLTLELMAVGYLYRIAWFVGFLAIGLVWPALFLDADFKAKNEALLLAWGILCIATGLFTISDIDKQESIPILVLSGLTFLGGGWLVVRKPAWFFPLSNGSATAAASDEKKEISERKAMAQAQDTFLQHTLWTIKAQLSVLLVTTAVTASSARSLQLKAGLPLANQAIAWVVLGISLVFPFAYGFRGPMRIAPPPTGRGWAGELVRQPTNQRLAIVVFAFAPIFILLSLRDEALFFGCYTLTLLVWAKMEGAVEEVRPRRADTLGGGRKLQLADLRISLFFLFFLHVGFFGTGNVASISSFYLSPVYRLVPIFSPFLMAALLLVKILVPFVILNAVFEALCSMPPNPVPASPAGDVALADDLRLVGAEAPGGLGLEGGLLALVFGACMVTDVLALNFLFAVKSQGSWLEIGQTITHFVMANLLQIFMLGLAALSSCIMSGRVAT